MRRRNVAIVLGILTIIAFSVPFIPMWVLIPTTCQGVICLDSVMHSWGYGSVTYYLFGLGATYHAGIYGFTIGK